MVLTDTAIKTSKPKNTDYKIADEKGLYVLVKQRSGTLTRSLGWRVTSSGPAFFNDGRIRHGYDRA